MVANWVASRRSTFVPESFDLQEGSMLASATSTRRATAVPKTLPVRAAAPRRQLGGVVRSAGEGRLVGLPAPEFEAEAVYDQEFINVKLSDYKYDVIALTCLVCLPLAGSEHTESPSLRATVPWPFL